MLQKIFGGKRKEQESVAPPVIKRREEDLPPEIRYALKPKHVYRVFPPNAPESTIQEPCGSCGHNYDGPTQTHCPACNSDRKAYMRDVTDEPFHTLPPATPGEQREIDANDLIPTFGGESINIGQDSSLVMVQGDKVIIGSESSVRFIAGNTVEVGQNSSIEYASAKNQLTLYSDVACEGDITAKSISLGSSCKVRRIVVPDGGVLRLNDNVSVDTIFLGQGARIVGSPGDASIGLLVILEQGCSVFLGNDCQINYIEAENTFNLSTGRNFDNSNHDRFSEKYNLAVLISDVVNASLGKDD